MGLLSLLGFIEIFTDEKGFLAFFAFVVDFEYLFMKSDEMLEEYMKKEDSLFSESLIRDYNILIVKYCTSQNNIINYNINYYIILILLKKLVFYLGNDL